MTDILSLTVPTGWKLVPVDDPSRSFADPLIPDAMVSAGIEAMDRADDDLRANLPDGIDWDTGMICVAVYRAMLAASPTPPAAEAPGQDQDWFSLEQVKAEREEGSGIWITCTGCYETSDGYPPAGATHNKAFGCILGGGCRECGGIGAIWDTTDYEDMARFIGAADVAEAPWQEPVAVCEVLTMHTSSGFPDHFARVTVGDRSLEFFMSKIKGQAEYHAAELDWLLNGAEKPDILGFDYAEPEGLAEYHAARAAPPTYADAEAKGFARGIEAAAKLHDAEADRHDMTSVEADAMDFGDSAKWHEQRAQEHRANATAIRSLASPAPKEPGQ